jgi:hypothetical protein
MTTTITIVCDDDAGDDEANEVELPEADATTKALKSAGVKGKLKEKSLAPLAAALGISPSATRAVVAKAKSVKASKAAKAAPAKQAEAPIPTRGVANAAQQLGVSEADLRHALGMQGLGRRTLDKSYEDTRKHRK